VNLRSDSFEKEHEEGVEEVTLQFCKTTLLKNRSSVYSRCVRNDKSRRVSDIASEGTVDAVKRERVSGL